MAKPLASLHILVQKGTNLRHRAKGQSTNSYVSAVLGDQKAETRVIKDSISPVWGEVLTLQHVDEKAKSVRFSVLNHNSAARLQFGKADLALRYLQPGEQDVTLSLPMNASLTLTVTYEPGDYVDRPLANSELNKWQLSTASVRLLPCLARPAPPPPCRRRRVVQKGVSVQTSHDFIPQIIGSYSDICDSGPLATAKLEELFMEWMNTPTMELMTQTIQHHMKMGLGFSMDSLGPRRITPTSLPRAPKMMSRRRTAPPLTQRTGSRLSIGMYSIHHKRFSEPILSKRPRLSVFDSLKESKDDISASRSSSLDSALADTDVEKPGRLEPVEEEKPKEEIPQFYFPSVELDKDADAEERIRNQWAETCDNTGENASMEYDDFKSVIATLCGFPSCVMKILFQRCVSKDTDESITLRQFLVFYKTHLACKGLDEMVFSILRKRHPRYIVAEDIEPMVQEVCDGHQGLDFLRGEEVFQEAYVRTVKLRILYFVGGNKAHISLRSWMASNVVATMLRLDQEQDINQVTEYFSYNHFYVIWCLFWELDQDEDTLLSKQDLLRYAQHSLSDRIVDRIFGMRRDPENDKTDMMSYPDFVYFLLSEEDKRTDSSLDYWFTCVDVDGDGVITASDMRWFYEEQERKLDRMGEEVITFEEMLNEFHDMIHPEFKNRFTRRDVAKCGLGANVFDALFNVKKLLAWEELGSEKAAGRVHYVRNFKDWDLFASREYTRLAEDDEEDA